MSKEKHAKIIEIMEQRNVISVKELSELLGCSDMTIRRNLDELQEMQFVKREHGYATLLKPAKSTDYYAEMETHTPEKKAIAQVALSYLQPEQSYCFDSGTTVQQLAELVPDELPCSVITPSLTVAMTLSHRSQVQVLMPEGHLHHSNRSLLLSEPDALQKYRVDIAFLSCRAFQIPGGAFEHSQTMTTTKRALSSIARRRILLIDHSKWNVTSICNSVPLEEIDLIITDDLAPQETVDATVTAGKEVIVVETASGKIVRHDAQPGN